MNIIIGGTGTLGKAVTKKLIKDGHSVTIFSRDELKQKQMSHEFPTARYIMGDVRDPISVRNAIKGHKNVFLFAAIKHVSAAEENPIEAIKTNITGAINVIDACNSLGVENLTFSSTDKAVAPINTYGHTKAIAERLILRESKCVTSVCRYGNVLGSRGSVLGTFIHALNNKQPITITDPRMTRFWIKIEDAADFVLERTGKQGLHIPILKGSTVLELAEAVALAKGYGPFEVKNIGIYPGEKLHEQLSDTMFSHTVEQYSVAELVGIVRGML